MLYLCKLQLKREIEMRKFKTAIFFTVSLATAFQAQAQDPEFTQFYAAPIYTNPAMAGTAAPVGH